MHLAFADRYELFRDERYFIVCGRHPAFGYADQPPLVPLLAAAGYMLGGHTWIVRLPSVLAAAAPVWLGVSFVRLLGGRDGAAWLAGIATGVVPMLLGLSATLNTNAFEPLAWTAVAYGVARAALPSTFADMSAGTTSLAKLPPRTTRCRRGNALAPRASWTITARRPQSTSTVELTHYRRR